MKEGIKLMKNINFAPFLEKDEKIKPIKDHEDYYISSYGKIFSTKQGYIRQLKPFLDGKGNYRIIRLDYKKYLLHRIVAINFIPNPKNLPGLLNTYIGMSFLFIKYDNLIKKCNDYPKKEYSRR